MFELKLVGEVKKHECIYNKDHIDFRNKEIKESTWVLIESAVGEDEEKCRLRWKTLRERYVREYSKMTANPKYKSKWRFTELMSFMQNYIDPKPSYCEDAKVRPTKEIKISLTKNERCFPKKFEHSLIAKVKKYQFIYDKDHRDFRNKQKKEEAWLTIARSTGATEQQCRNRWKTLRERFVNEQIKCFANGRYKSPWKYFGMMSFMKLYVTESSRRRELILQIPKKEMYCRTCLHQILSDSGQKSCESQNIFETSDLAEQLMQCTNLELESWDEYPNSICDMCYEKILEFIQFQLMCRDSLEKFCEILQHEAEVKHQSDYEDTMDTTRSYFTDSSNVSYIDPFVENEEEADSRSQVSDELNYLNETNNAQIGVKCEDQLDEMEDCDPLAEQSTDNTIYEITTPSEEILEGNMNSCDDDDDMFTTEKIRSSRTKARKNVNMKFESRSKKMPVESAHTKRGKPPVIEVVQIQRETAKVYDQEDPSDEEDMSNSDADSMPAQQLKANTTSNRLQYKCNLCPKSYDFKFRLQAHQRTHKLLQGFPCTYGKCQRCFSRLDLLQKHLDDHNTLPVFTCDIGDCERMYKTLFNLRQHKLKFHNYEEPRLEERFRDHRGYTCDICGKTFSLPLSLRNHRFVHLDKSKWPFPCDEDGCTKRFQTRYFLKLHKQRHAGIRNHICSYCGLRTVTLAELNRHINIHTFERKYPCPFCPKVSKSSADRGNHIRRVHDKPKVYPCRICDGTFTSAYNRDHHEMAHKGIKPYSCDVCNKQFKWKTGLQMHTKIVHLGGKPYECDVCGKEFNWHGSLTKHKKTHLMDETKYTPQGEETNDEEQVIIEDNVEELIEDENELYEYTFEIETNVMESD